MDAQELRRYARKIAHPAGDVPAVMLAAAEEIERLAARLEATEEDRARFLVEMGRLCAQCDTLRLRIKAAEKERDALRAKIEAMEQQESVAHVWRCDNGHMHGSCERELPISQPLYLAAGAQPAPSFADAYQGAMEEVAIWKMRALEAEDMNRKFIAEINGPAHMGEPAQPAQSAPEDVMRDAERYRYLRARDDETAGVGCWLEAKGRVCDRGWLYGDQLDSAIDTCIEMLSVAQEAKP